MRNKRSLTLLEVMIAFSLLSIILFFLLSPFKELAILSSRMGSASSHIMQTHRIRGKLMRLFSQIEDDFSFENEIVQCKTKIGTDPDPDFSSSVKIKLYKNSNNELVLTTTATEAKKERQQILARDITKLTWTFYKLDKGKYTSSHTWDDSSIPDCIKLT